MDKVMYRDNPARFRIGLWYSVNCTSLLQCYWCQSKRQNWLIAWSWNTSNPTSVWCCHWQRKNNSCVWHRLWHSRWYLCQGLYPWSDFANAQIKTLNHLMYNIASVVLIMENGKGFSVHHIIEVARWISKHDMKVIDSVRTVGDPLFW